MEMMLEAIFEQGVLRPTSPLTGLVEGQRVSLVVREQEYEAGRESELLRRLEAEGLLVRTPSPAGPVPAGFRPLNLQGEPLSEEIIRERR